MRLIPVDTVFEYVIEFFLESQIVCDFIFAIALEKALFMHYFK